MTSSQHKPFMLRASIKGSWQLTYVPRPNPTMTGWEKLPTELRLMIFGVLVLHAAAEKKTGGETYPLTRYSLVCRDWQFFFERQLYRSLSLNQFSLFNFASIVRRQRLFVEHIRVTLDMETYDCLKCTRWDLDKTLREGRNVSDTLQHLFNTLGDWRRDQVGCPEGVTLEITGHQRWDLRGRCVPTPYIKPGSGLNGVVSLYTYRLRPHLDPRYSKKLGRLLPIDLGPGLREVKVVTKLVVPQKSRFRLTHALQPMMESLPNLHRRTVIRDDDGEDAATRPRWGRTIFEVGGQEA